MFRCAEITKYYKIGILFLNKFVIFLVEKTRNIIYVVRRVFVNVIQIVNGKTVRAWFKIPAQTKLRSMVKAALTVVMCRSINSVSPNLSWHCIVVYRRMFNNQLHLLLLVMPMYNIIVYVHYCHCLLKYDILNFF